MVQQKRAMQSYETMQKNIYLTKNCLKFWTQGICRFWNVKNWKLKLTIWCYQKWLLPTLVLLGSSTWVCFWEWTCRWCFCKPVMFLQKSSVQRYETMQSRCFSSPKWSWVGVEWPLGGWGCRTRSSRHTKPAKNRAFIQTIMRLEL